MESGTRIGHYEILERLGAGGMGEVYRAVDARLKREVALKLLPPDVGADERLMARFQREAELLAAVSHPNIATIHNVEHEGGRPFLVLELIEGDSLASRLQQGAMPAAEALVVAAQVALALEAAHERDIVHRDLKPANVMLLPDGNAKVLDFGIAKPAPAPQRRRAGADASQVGTVAPALTEDGSLVGTIPYMSPEQVRGEAADRRSDIWAFGCLLFEMLSGARAFDRQTPADTLSAVLNEEPDWSVLPDATPAAARALLHRCLQKEPRRRLRDIGDAWIDLTEPSGEIATVSTVTGAGSRAGSQQAGQRLAVALTAVVTAAVVGPLVWLSTRPPAPEPAVSVRVDARIGDEPISHGWGPGFALSPDGTRIAYVVGDPLAESELHLRSLATMQDTTLVVGRPHTPFFSPDGESVGFFTMSELKAVPAVGGQARTVAATGYTNGGSWSADGTIVYAPDALNGLLRVPAGGGVSEPLTTLDAQRGEQAHVRPHALPGGDAVLFTSVRRLGDSMSLDVELVDVATGERQVVLEGGFDARYVPTGHLVYGSSSGLFAVPFDPARREVVGAPVAVVSQIATIPKTGAVPFSFASSGTMTYVGGQAPMQRYPVVWVDRTGETSSLWQRPGTYTDPSLSPDGTRLVLSALGDDGLDLWLYDIERRTSTQLTFDRGVDIYPVWSPDGEYLAWASSRAGGTDVYRMRADGSGQAVRLAESEDIIVPSSWSADGSLMALVVLRLGGDSVDMDLWTLRLDAEAQPEVFLATDAVEDWPAVSPDGRWIAYGSDESGRFEVYVRPYPVGPGKWHVSADGGGQPRWSGDGRQLYYRTDDGVMLVPVNPDADDFAPGPARELFRGNFRGGTTGLNVGGTVLIRDYDVARDGERFVMFPGRSGSSGGADLTFVFNWFDELRRLAPVETAAGSGR